MDSESSPLLVRQRPISNIRAVLSESHRSRSAPCHTSCLECVSEDYNNQPNNESPPMSSNSSTSTASHSVVKTTTFPKNKSLKLWDVLPYYLPCFSWLPSYDLRKFFGDFIAGVSLASFQIPLAMSYATSIAHVEPLCGLYALAFTPFFYAIFGSVPQMIVGPESAISLVVGQAIEPMIRHDPSLSSLDLCVIITFISGVVLFTFGVFRFGFLDNVLSRAFLRGFISAVGVIMVINSLIVELKLKKVFDDAPSHYHSPFEKVLFLIKYAPANYHLPTSLLSLCCFLILMSLRLIKKKLLKRFRSLVFFPEILLVVVTVIFFSYNFDLKHRYNIEVVGDIEASVFDKLRNPLSKNKRPFYGDLFSAGFMVAMLGFFESTTASKSLGTAYDLAVSSNRELVALGSLNLIGSLFGALPSFGGYGRSKINAYSGAQTVVSGACMGTITMFTIKFLLKFIRYIPVCVLSVITTVVGLSLLEEAPADLRFHIRCRGYNELISFIITVLTTFFYSVEAGITVGCGYSIIRVIKHSTKSRIQILGKLAGTNKFVNADEYEGKNSTSERRVNPQLEEIEGCLIVRIPEPLTFTNTDDLKTRLNRLELYGSTKTHPAAPRSRDQEMTKYVIFDLHGMTTIDSSAIQILQEIISSYKRRHVHVFLVRVPSARKVRNRFVNSGILEMVESDIHRSLLPSAQQMLTSSPYFETIEEALRIVDELELRAASHLDTLSVCNSIISRTFVNSSMV